MLNSGHDQIKNITLITARQNHFWPLPADKITFGHYQIKSLLATTRSNAFWPLPEKITSGHYQITSVSGPYQIKCFLATTRDKSLLATTR
jgi:hypothetical protein